MSNVQTETAPCPQCQTPLTIALYETINSSLNPDVTARLMQGELFKYRCPNCGATGQAFYPVLYNDVAHKVMVQFTATNDVNVAQQYIEEHEKRKTQFEAAGFPMSDYRVVIDPNDLVEKAQIFDAGFDDRVMEVVKVFYKMSWLEENKFYRNAIFRFAKGTAKPFFFVMDEQGNVLTRLRFGHDYYEMIKNTLRLDEIDSAVVNENWAREYLDQHIADFQLGDEGEASDDDTQK